MKITLLSLHGTFLLVAFCFMFKLRMNTFIIKIKNLIVFGKTLNSNKSQIANIQLKE
jgi:hypothetical protein